MTLYSYISLPKGTCPTGGPDLERIVAGLAGGQSTKSGFGDLSYVSCTSLETPFVCTSVENPNSKLSLQSGAPQLHLFVYKSSNYT